MSGKNTLTHQIQQTGTLTQRMQRIFPNKIFSCCIQFCPFLDHLLFPSSFYLQGFFGTSSSFFKSLQRKIFQIFQKNFNFFLRFSKIKFFINSFFTDFNQINLKEIMLLHMHSARDKCPRN